MLIAKTHMGKEVGTIVFTGKRLTSDNPGIESMIDSAMRRNNGNALEAYRELSRFSNGYLAITEAKDDRKATPGSVTGQRR
jgi:hypothetical protein